MASPEPQVVVLQDADIFPMRLPETLVRARCRVCEVFPHVGLSSALEALGNRPDLLILAIRSSEPETVERIRKLQWAPDPPRVPILGVVGRDRAELDLMELRGLGVAGLLERNAVPDHVVFRVNQLLKSFPDRRSQERAPAFFPVELEADGTTTTECAVSLSLGGIGLASSRPVETNTDVALRLWPMQSGREIENVKGRVTHCSNDPAAIPCNRLGVVFYAVDAEIRQRLVIEVEKLLAYSGHRAGYAPGPDTEHDQKRS